MTVLIAAGHISTMIHFNRKNIVPEFGGDGKKPQVRCAGSVVAFPAHLAPNALLFYTGSQFPENIRTEHCRIPCSWNRAGTAQDSM